MDVVFAAARDLGMLRDDGYVKYAWIHANFLDDPGPLDSVRRMIATRVAEDAGTRPELVATVLFTPAYLADAARRLTATGFEHVTAPPPDLGAILGVVRTP